jgi:alpha-glucosidase (family GH31 glycosyl hydrolase)
MPLEVMWLDIPYLDKYSDFSVDNTAFPNIQGLADGLHLNN